MFESKYLFEKNVRLKNGEVTALKEVHDTSDSAELKYYDEVSYGLQLDTLELGYYKVTNEFGVTYLGLERTINRIPAEPEQPQQS